MRRKWLHRIGAVLLLGVILSFSSCATSTAIPPNATPEQITEITAKNAEAAAKNSSTSLIITFVSIGLELLAVLIIR